jgi:hypothetical protein
MVHATTTEYLLPEDLLNDACDAYRFATQPEVLKTLPESTIDGLRELAEIAKMINIDAISTDALVHSDPQWSGLREKAQRCLAKLGFALSEWEHEEGLVENAGGTSS